MINIGEEFVSVWLQFCKNEFVMRNIPYREQRTDSKGRDRWTNREIDILSTDGRGNFSEFEVKWRTTSWVGHTDKEGIEKLVDQINNSYRRKLIKKLTGKTPQRFLVTQKRYFGTAEKREDRIRALKRSRIQVLWFEDIIHDLLEHLDTYEGSGKFDPLILKTIREIRTIE